MQKLSHNEYKLAAQAGAPSSYFSKSSILTMTPPATDPAYILQRVDEVHTVLRMLGEAQTNVVMLTGDAGVGKSTLAALLFHFLQSHGQTGPSMARHYVWITLSPNATLPDVIAAILNRINMNSPDFYLLKPEHQISLLVQALSRQQENTFIVLNQFEELLHPETGHGLAGRGAISLFLERMQNDIGASCLLLTGQSSPYPQNQSTNVRSYLVSRVSTPEGIALLLQRGVPNSSHQELSLVWQRCGGQVFALVLFSALYSLSGFSLGYLLNSPDYQPLWNGEVTLNLIGTCYYYLNPIQRTLIRALCLFYEPISLQGISVAIMGDNSIVDLEAFERELSTLTNLALVQRSIDEKGQGCYQLHSLLSQCIIEHYLEGSDRHPSGDLTVALGVSAMPHPILTNPEARQIAIAAGHMRVAAYYRRLADDNCPPREQRNGLQDVEPLLHVVRHLCLGWHWQQAYDLLLAENLHESMLRWGAWNILIGLYMSMVPPGGILSRRDEGQVLSNMGLLYGRLGTYDQSFVYYQLALNIQREINDEHGLAITLANQGELLRSQGQFSQARMNFEQAHKLNEQQQDPLLESILLHNLGLLNQLEKNYLAALNHYMASLKIARILNEHYNEGMILTNIGMLLYEQGNLPEALSLLFYAIHLRRSIQDSSLYPVLLFVSTLEQRMGREAFAQLYQVAMAIQETPEQLLSRLLSANMRQ